MKLTRTNRIIIVVAGLGIVVLLLFPPFHVLVLMPYPPHMGLPENMMAGREEIVHRWIGTSPRDEDSFIELASVHRGLLITQIVGVLVLAGALMAMFGNRSKFKKEPDKDA